MCPEPFLFSTSYQYMFSEQHQQLFVCLHVRECRPFQKKLLEGSKNLPHHPITTLALLLCYSRLTKPK